MKSVILTGGLRTRVLEETALKSKPMIETGGKPILWHMLKIHLFYVINEFIIYPGHKSYTINFFL